MLRMVGKDLDFLHISWKQAQRLCEILAEKILESSYEPEMVVAISRGGFPPARILCDLLDIRILASIGLRYYSSVNVAKAKPIIVFPLSIDVKGKTILIVDDVVDSGHTLAVVKRIIIKENANDVRIAALHYKPQSILTPAFYAQETEAWVVYPWEIRETIRDLAGNFQREGKDISTIFSELKRLGFSKKAIEAFLYDGRKIEN